MGSDRKTEYRSEDLKNLWALTPVWVRTAGYMH